jgi:hypothetical protein
MVLTLIGGLVDLSHTQATRGGKTLKEKMKIEEVREMGASSSYLTGQLHNPSFASRYIQLSQTT